jgi:DNA (cytosine-5)-methyltransferase 1
VAQQLELERAVDSRDAVLETFGLEGKRGLSKHVCVGAIEGPVLTLQAPGPFRRQSDLRGVWDQAWLRSKSPPVVRPGPSEPTRSFRIVDVFAGCGAMSLGVKTAAESLGFRFESCLAADFEPAALGVYETNLKPARVFDGDILKLVDFKWSVSKGRPRLDARWNTRGYGELRGDVDLLIGGPPCQGHSDLNNHSRRDDPKNALYLVMPALARLLEPRAVFIENVPAVVHDRTGVVAATERLLEDAGYVVFKQVVAMAELGVPQRRKRHVLIAVRNSRAAGRDRASGPGVRALINAVFALLRSDERSVDWAIGDLRLGDHLIDTASTQTAKNLERIDWLFDNDRHDLPDHLRPDCHRLKKHSYVSMYGRMVPDLPAQTITSGFGSPGQGRFIHPREKRTITPHEAARLQFFPDFFSFESARGALSRVQIAQMIGNAVPPKLSYAVTLGVVAALDLGRGT